MALISIHSFTPLFIFTPYISASTRTSGLKKLDYSQLHFGKGHFAFNPIRLSRYAKKDVS